jgi:hypothetical protein
MIAARLMPPRYSVARSPDQNPSRTARQPRVRFARVFRMVSVRIGEALQNGRCSFDVSEDLWFGNREMSLAARCVWPGK